MFFLNLRSIFSSKTSVKHSEGRKLDIYVIAKFPSIEKATEAVESNDYKAISDHRANNNDIEYGFFLIAEGLQKRGIETFS